MNYRYMRWIGVPVLSLMAATVLPDQENSAKRLASIVGVAAEEYAKAVDDHGQLISKDEFDETYGFLTDAKQVATRINGYDAAASRAILDSMIAAVAQRKPPAVVKALHQHFAASLGTAGAMDLPSGPLDTVEGHTLFLKNCSSCHGQAGV